MSNAALSPASIIARKRDGHALADGEIAAFVRGATDGTWADYQLSALLMAIYLRGMDSRETSALTAAMMRSGSIADLSHVPGLKVDKHSTGGVGDKVSLPLAALVAACGVPVPMISGRGLGHTGGTLDKLESIPGFRTGLSLEDFRSQVGRVGCALAGQTRELAPADRKLYALRDVTATVECLPLICASIMSKKLAEGLDALVLDVKFGRGAFMKTQADARNLAAAMCEIGRTVGKPTRALLTRMDQPLGRAVGNALEVAESIALLRGEADAPDLLEITLAIGSEMLVLGDRAQTTAEARSRLETALADGSALEKFREIVAAQGGNPRVCDQPATILPTAACVLDVRADQTGFVQTVDAMAVALAALAMGAGRQRADDTIEPAVGFSSLVKIGEATERGGLLARVHARNQAEAEAAASHVRAAIQIGPQAPQVDPLIAERLSPA